VHGFFGNLICRFFGLLCGGAQEEATCKTVSPVSGFNLDQFISAKWYAQEQQEVLYQPLENFYCVTAEYTKYENPTFWGYTIRVDNRSKDKDGNDSNAILGAKLEGSPTVGELIVAPDFLPDVAGGPYWVVAYDEDEGYALISNGAPDEPSDNGGCTVTSFTGGGLWIFTRDWRRDETLIQKVTGIAKDLGYDTSVLNTVSQDQTLCGWS